MHFPLRFHRRALAALSAAALFAPLAGCQNQKIVARVNDVQITDEEFSERAARIKSADFRAYANSPLDSGGVALVTLIKEKMLEKLGSDKKAIPSEDVVTQFEKFATRSTPAVAQQITAGQITKEDVHRVVRDQLILIALGSNGATVSEDDIKKQYETNKAQYAYPELYTIRFVPVPSEAEGVQLISQIKATGDFPAAAAKITPGAGQLRVFPTDPAQMPPPLKAVLDKLKDNELSPSPVSVETQPGSPPIILVVQRISHMEAGQATLAEAHEAVRQRVIQEKQPQIAQHSQELLTEFQKSAKVDIYIPRYVDAVKAALVPPPPQPAMTAPPGGTPGGAVPPGTVPPPTTPSTGGAAPGRTPRIIMPGGAKMTPGGSKMAPGAGATAPTKTGR